jgi:hypothetical protein
MFCIWQILSRAMSKNVCLSQPFLCNAQWRGIVAQLDLIAHEGKVHLFTITSTPRGSKFPDHADRYSPRNVGLHAI